MTKYETRIFYFTKEKLLDLVDQLVYMNVHKYTPINVENNNDLCYLKPCRIIVHVDNCRITDHLKIFKSFLEVVKANHSSSLIFILAGHIIDRPRWVDCSHFQTNYIDELSRMIVHHFEHPLSYALSTVKFNMEAIEKLLRFRDDDFHSQVQEIKMECISKKLPFIWIYDHSDIEKIRNIYSSMKYFK